MFEVSEEISWKVRKRRAFERKSVSEVANEIGISRQTLREIESGKKLYIRKTIYIKLIDWLFKGMERVE